MIPSATAVAWGWGQGTSTPVPRFFAPTVMSTERLSSPSTLTRGKGAAGTHPREPSSHFITALANASTTDGHSSTYINSLTFTNFIYIYVFKNLCVFNIYINIQCNMQLISVLLQMFVYPHVYTDTTYASIHQNLY